MSFGSTAWNVTKGTFTVLGKILNTFGEIVSKVEAAKTKTDAMSDDEVKKLMRNGTGEERLAAKQTYMERHGKK